MCVCACVCACMCLWSCPPYAASILSVLVPLPPFPSPLPSPLPSFPLSPPFPLPSPLFYTASSDPLSSVLDKYINTLSLKDPPHPITTSLSTPSPSTPALLTESQTLLPSFRSVYLQAVERAGVCTKQKLSKSRLVKHVFFYSMADDWQRCCHFPSNCQPRATSLSPPQPL